MVSRRDGGGKQQSSLHLILPGPGHVLQMSTWFSIHAHVQCDTKGDVETNVQLHMR